MKTSLQVLKRFLTIIFMSIIKRKNNYKFWGNRLNWWIFWGWRTECRYSKTNKMKKRIGDWLFRTSFTWIKPCNIWWSIEEKNRLNKKFMSRVSKKNSENWHYRISWYSPTQPQPQPRAKFIKFLRQKSEVETNENLKK